PNATLGAVLEAPASAGGADATPPATAPATPAADPMRSAIERRPPGMLPGVVEKLEYFTQEGKQTLYIVVSFLAVETPEGPRERAIEFFMPVGQRSESQQWISASMRLLSLAARGGFLERALADMRKVVWDRGPVRLGERVRDDGARVPLWHDSEVAAIAYAIQQIIERKARPATPPNAPGAAAAIGATPAPLPGRKCPECGARAVIRRDGCDHCTACGHMGACG
ncbi:MAG: hypothetical protein N2688_02665, partial [Burkholderiaceae bacterium]|nr:hypothetical protein [Burkholderiaceae bacterium]